MSADRTWTNKKNIMLMLICFFVGIAAGIAAVRLPDWIRNQKNVAKKQTEEKGYDAVKIVKLGEYKGIKVTITPTEEELQEEIDAFLEEHVNYEQVKGTAEDGDKVHVQITASVDGNEADIAQMDDYMDLGSGLYLADLENAVIGMKTGQKKKVNIQVPKGYYGDNVIDGEEAVFQIKLDYICGDAILPDYNDEFVSAVTNYHSVKEYNAYLTEKLTEENEEDKVENAWAVVLEKSEIDDGDYPESVLKQQRQEILQGYYDLAKINGSTRDEVFQQFGCADEQDFIDTELDDLAKDGAKDILVSEAIAVKENIYYTEQEYKSLLNQDYEDNKDMYKNKEEYEKKNKAYLENTALMEAVKSFIDKNADYIILDATQERHGRK